MTLIESFCDLGNTGDEIIAITVSSISPRLKHFSDWLLKANEEGNLEIFPASSRENAQTVADLWRVPSIQATYKSLRDTLPRNAVYFLGRVSFFCIKLALLLKGREKKNTKPNLFLIRFLRSREQNTILLIWTYCKRKDSRLWKDFLLWSSHFHQHVKKRLWRPSIITIQK